MHDDHGHDDDYDDADDYDDDEYDTWGIWLRTAWVTQM